ncbi:Phosphate acyltransferase [Rhizoctonia solani]|uniref:Phosphate acyltransferase n=1 Tax=Rhizoctonia solani TaxID=456999 RepID=A0A8H7INR0_9AGAM|nr:Phosphate acyltransferase [Rhizoctonia solani]
MQRKRSGASPNVRFASQASSRRTTITSITEEGSSARTSSIDVAPVDAAGRPIYEIWEPPEETVLEHYNNEQEKGGTSAGTKLGKIVAAVVRSRYTGGSVYLPRFSRSSLARTRSVVSESDVTSVSPHEVSRDVHKIGLPMRTTTVPPASARPPLSTRTQPPPSRVTPPVPRSVSQPTVPLARRPTLPAAAPKPALRPSTPPRAPAITPALSAIPVSAPKPTPAHAHAPKPIPVARPAPTPTSAITPAPAPKPTPFSRYTPPSISAPTKPIPPKPTQITRPTPTTKPVLIPKPTSIPKSTLAPIPTTASTSPVSPVSPTQSSTSRTLASALAPSTTNPLGATSPISENTYRMINNAAYKPQVLPPPGTIIESSGEGIMRAERALYAELSIRPVDERIYWTMPPDHDERVRNRIRDVDKASRELALYGLDMYLALGVKGAIMTNAGYHAPEWPDSPAYDWITFDDARKTGDKVLQESIAFTDPSKTTLVFIFLMSRSGESMAIWRRKFTVPPSEQLARNLELRKVAYEAQKRGQVYEIDLSPQTMVVEEDAWILVVPEGKEKKQRKFPCYATAVMISLERHLAHFNTNPHDTTDHCLISAVRVDKKAWFHEPGQETGNQANPLDILLCTFVLKVFYGTIVVENEHFIPKNGDACIVCANHSNSLTDALRNLLRLTAKDTQFGKPTFQSWLIESAGTLPIKRRKDHAEGEADNTVVMGALVKALEEGDAICLFPEGMSRYHPSVAPMKTGVARIASDVLTQQKDNPDFCITLLTCSITYMHREHFRSDVLVSFNPPLKLTPKARILLGVTHTQLTIGMRSLTTFLYDQITQGTITAPSWKIIRTAKAASRIYVPLGTGMGLGDWVRVVGRFAGEAGFGGVGKVRSRKPSLHSSASSIGKSGIISAEWQPGPSEEEAVVENMEHSSISDEFVETLARDIQLYQSHLERLGLKDFRVLQYNTLSRRRIASRILIRIPLIVALGTLALPGLALWLPVFATVAYFTKKHKQTGPVWDTYDEISQTKLIYGLAAGATTWLIACVVTFPFAPATALLVPGVMWMALRWTEDLVAGVRSVVALARLLLVGKPEMNKTLLWRGDIHARVMKLAIERLELPANPEEFFSTKKSPGPRWDTKGGADKGRTQGLWARGTRYFSLRRRRKRDWNETMRWYDQTYFPDDEL